MAKQQTYSIELKRHAGGGTPSIMSSKGYGIPRRPRGLGLPPIGTAPGTRPASRSRHLERAA